MRSLKTFLRNKKNRCCEGNKCVLVGMRRDFQSYPEFCNCGDGGSTPPVPPVPGFTYTLEKTSTRGNKDTYTASKYDNTDTLVKAYSLSVEYYNEEDIASFKIGDCTGECVWQSLADSESYFSFTLAYVNKTENALSAGTQEAFKGIFEEYEALYNGDDGKVYCLANNSETSDREGVKTILYYYIFSEGSYVGSRIQFNSSYALGLEYNKSTGDLVFAGIDNESGSFDFTNIPDSSQALALKAEYDSIIANISQAACKEGFEDAEALYNSLQ